MKQKLIVMAFMLFGGLLKSQSVPMALEDWKTTDGTQNFFFKNAIATDPSGNTIIAGATMSNGFPDILVAKYSSAGAQLWIKQFPGATNGIDFAAGLTVTNTDVYVTGAITNNSVTLLTECITMRLASSTGSVVWSSTYIGAAGIADLGKSININGSGDVFVTGGNYNSNFNTDFLTIKYDGATGTQLWDNTWDYTAGLNDAAYKVNFSGSNVIVGGAVTDGVNTYKYAALTLSQSTGSLLATSIGAGVTTTSVDAVTDVITDNAGYIIIAGSMDVVGQGTNFFVQKLDPANLASVWIYSWNGAGSMNDYVKGISVDASNNVYLSGYTSTSGQGRDIIAIKLNSSGTQQWSQTINGSFNGDDEAGDIAVDASGNSYITGYTTKSINNSNYYTAKLNTSGTKIWEKETEGNGLNTTATNIELDLMNNIIVTGQSETSPGNYEFLTVKYVQRDVITPTDFNGEGLNKNYRFFANTGQLIGTNGAPVPDVKYYTHQTNPAVYFKDKSQSFVFSKIDSSAVVNDTLHRIDLSFNSDVATKSYPMEKQKDFYLNYFLSHTDSNGVTGVHGNQRLITPNLYNNIDLMCSSNKNGIKYYFIVKPGGDPREIQMEFAGATSFSLSGSNVLSVNSTIGSLTFKQPIAYQLTATNSTVAVTGWTADWQTNGASNKYKFNTGAYTTSLTLVIQVSQPSIPTSPANAAAGNLNYSTYYGSVGHDGFNDIKVDNNFRYVTGYTYSGAFPVFNNVLLYKGGIDAVLLKYTLNSDSLQFATFFGGIGDDVANAIVVAKTGGIYIGGTTTSSNMPIYTKTGATMQNTVSQAGAAQSGFLAEFRNTGSAVLWSRYVGGTYKDYLNGMTLDSLDNLYVCGTTGSQDFPVTSSGYKHYMYGQYNANEDMFVMKFNAGSAVQWSTFYGGDIAAQTPTSTTFGKDAANAIAVDNLGYIYVAGTTECIDYPVIFPGTPTSNSTYYTTKKSLTDAALVKFDPTGTPVWSTYFGGNGDDQINDIKLDRNNDMIIVGSTSSNDTTTFPVKRKTGAFNYIHNYLGEKAFFSKINSNYDNTWTTFYSRHAYSVMSITKATVVNDGFIVSGHTTSDSINIPASMPYGAFAKSTKSPTTSMGFLAYFGSGQGLVHAHYFGGNYYYSAIKSITNDKNNALYFVGYATAAYPIAYTTANATLIDSTYGGGPGTDGCITRLMLSSIPVSLSELTKSGIESINVYPNPVFNTFSIDLHDLKGTEYYSGTIYNLQGQIITTFTNKDFNTDIIKINCSNWSSGIYIVSVLTDSGKYATKLVKQ